MAIKPQKINRLSPTVAGSSAPIAQPQRHDPNRELEEVLTGVRKRRLLDAEIQSLTPREEEGKNIREAEVIQQNGFWDFLAQTTQKPTDQLTVKEVMELMKEFQQQQPQGQPVQSGQDAMMPFLQTLMQQMKPMSAEDFAGIFQMAAQMFAPGGEKESDTDKIMRYADVLDKLGLLDKIRGNDAPSQQSGFNVTLPGGEAVPYDQLVTFMDHQFNLRQKEEEWKEKRENQRATRENIPRLMEVLETAAGSLGELVQERRSEGHSSRSHSRSREGRSPQEPVKELIECAWCGAPNRVDNNQKRFVCGDCEKPNTVEPSPGSSRAPETPSEQLDRNKNGDDE